MRNVLVTAVVLAMLLAAPVYADLATSLTNADLETPDLGFDTFAASIQDWSECLVGTNDAVRHFDETVLGARILASTPTQFGFQVFETGGNTGDIVASYQSLGTVGAGDVGETFSFTADGYIEPIGWLDGAPFGYISEFQGDMQVSLRSATTATSLGTLMGTAGPVNSYDSTDIPFDYGIPPVYLDLADWNLGTASYTVGAGDVGTEIFVLVATELTSIIQDPGGQGQGFVWDTAILTTGSASVPGDANGDGKVTDADYTIWADTYLSTTDLRADWNDSGDVTDADYTIWADNYGVGTGSVPEPATLALLLLGGLAMLRRRK